MMASNPTIERLISAVAETHPNRGGQAALATEMGVSEAFISKCVKRGWFPHERAKTLAHKYDVPMEDLVKPSLRDTFAS